MRIVMLKDSSGSKDGIHVEYFKKDSEHDVPDDLAKNFISGGYAEEFKPGPVQTPVEEKKSKKDDVEPSTVSEKG